MPYSDNELAQKVGLSVRSLRYLAAYGAIKPIPGITKASGGPDRRSWPEDAPEKIAPIVAIARHGVGLKAAVALIKSGYVSLKDILDNYEARSIIELPRGIVPLNRTTKSPLSKRERETTAFPYLCKLPSGEWAFCDSNGNRC